MDKKKTIKFNTKRKKVIKKPLNTEPETTEAIKDDKNSDASPVSDTKETNTQSTNPQENKNIFSFPEKRKKLMFIASVVLICILVTAYIAKAQTFKNKYFPNTVINGVDASYKTPDEVRSIIKEEIATYNLTIKSREQEDVSLSGTELGLEYQLDDTLDSILKEQKPMFWIWHLGKGINYGVSKTTSIDESVFQIALANLPCMDSSTFKKPQNAEISEYESEKGYTVVPSFRGSILDTEAAYKIIYDSSLALSPLIDLAAYDNLYKKPDIGDDDPVLLSKIDRLNQYAKTVIHYPRSVVLDGNTISRWLSLSEDGSVIVNEDGIVEYVKTLAEALDTVGKPKTFNTSYGSSVSVPSKQYGWKVDQAAEVNAIKELLPNGESIEREPVYSSRAASLEENDYGNTYVEINLTAQHLHYYKDGALVLESDLVSGNLARGHRTPPGIFTVYYKQRNAVLRGPGYAAPVSYWMPFNGGIGLHDASWRSSFGGNIYKTGGSHGCINLPFSVAKQIYATIEKGCPVICYYMDSTETSQQTAATRHPAPAAPAPVAPTPEPTTAAAVAESTSSPETAEESSSAPIGPGMISQPTKEEIGPGMTAEETSPPSSDMQISNEPPKASGQVSTTPAASQDTQLTPVETPPAPTQNTVTDSTAAVQTSPNVNPVIPVPERPAE